MSQTSVHLTPMEEQMLRAYDHAFVLYPGMDEFTDANLQRAGQMLFGDQWGGRAVELKQYKGSYFPLVCRFLGRLKHKGLVERLDSSVAREHHLKYGEWRLTDLGRAMLGVGSN